MKLRKGLSENFCTTLIDVIAGLLAFDATMQCTDPLPQPLTLASSTHGLSLGLRADYGPYRDAFAHVGSSLGQSRSTGIPTSSRFSLPDLIARPCRHHDNAMAMHDFAIENSMFHIRFLTLIYQKQPLSMICTDCSF
jgi:hypothetical protein